MTFVLAGKWSRSKLPIYAQYLRSSWYQGIRAPRPARTAFGERGPGNVIEKVEPYGQEALDYAVRKFMQRDVEVEFDSTDKSGGFIGAMYLNNRTDNAAVDLVREGLASVHSYSADTLPWSKHLYDAEVIFPLSF